MKALVTGGGGFLGQAIVRLLRARHDDVRSFSRNPYPELQALEVEHLCGQLSDPDAVLRAVDGCDIVYHVAALAGIWGRYEDFYATNVEGTVNVIEACRQCRVNRLVYTSSPSVIFDGTDMEGVDESVPYPQQYKAYYPQTKAKAEQLVLQANGHDLATVALRPHLIWGPGDNHLVPRILERGAKNQLRKIGERPCLVDTTYIDNAALAHIQVADQLGPDSSVSGKAYFISQGEPRPLWDIINDILDAGGLPRVTRTVSPQTAYAAGAILEGFYRLFRLEGEPRMTRFLAEELSTAHWFDLSAAQRDFGFSPQVTFNEGMKRLRLWLEDGRSK
jgi:nucleoside-diphosphate-sugar epimerase